MGIRRGCQSKEGMVDRASGVVWALGLVLGLATVHSVKIRVWRMLIVVQTVG